MRVGWSREEVQRTIEDYFDMLRQELRGEDYNKTEHRKRLLGTLSQRSNGAAELKHQNISAILCEIGLPFIDGYKPRSNYQGLLRNNVVEFLNRDPSILGLMEEAAERLPSQPDAFDVDPYAILVKPPVPISARIAPRLLRRERVVRKTNFELRDETNRRLGKLGEEFAVNFEKRRLSNVGREDLARRVDWVSQSRGDGAGYDIQSFDEAGGERFVEVKTTNYGWRFPFLVSNNEVEFSSEARKQYALYRVFNFSHDPHLFMLEGAISKMVTLNPVLYRAAF